MGRDPYEVPPHGDVPPDRRSTDLRITRVDAQTANREDQDTIVTCVTCPACKQGLVPADIAAWLTGLMKKSSKDNDE